MIVIVGDSWGCGEWEGTNNLHGGLAQYLIEDSYKVINLSVGGSSNWEIFERLELFFSSAIPRYLNEKIDKIFVFQTEWTRDLKLDRSTCVDVGIGTDAISCWQYRLSEIAMQQNIKIGLIGGCSDTMYFDKFEEEYPGLFVACQSFTNFLINNNHRVEKPCFFTRPDDHLFDKVKNHYKKYSSIANLTNDLEMSINRLNTWRDNKQWFYPDGNHANRAGHKKLYEFLKTQKTI